MNQNLLVKVRKGRKDTGFCLQYWEKLILSCGEWLNHSLPEMAVSPEGGVQNEEV